MIGRAHKNHHRLPETLQDVTLVTTLQSTQRSRPLPPADQEST
jgi:hypothetical protein